MNETNTVHPSDPSLVEYYEFGRGPAVVILHGGNCSADDWANLTPRLAQTYRVILPDGLVHPLDPWKTWLLLDHLGVHDVLLVGHSAGGNLAREMCRLQPDRARGFVCIDSSGAGPLVLARKLPNSKFSPKAAALYEQNRAAMEKLKPHHRGDYPSQITIDRRLLAYRREKMTPEERATTRVWPAPLVCRWEGPTPSAPQPISDTGKFIRCPTLILHTGRGKIAPGDIGQETIQQNIQADDVEYVVIQESGHWPWLEDEEGFLKVMEPFLARTSK